MRRIAITALLLSAFIFSGSPICFCEYDSNNLMIPTKYFKGRVIEIDLMSSSITVQEDPKADELKFKITEKTQVFETNTSSYMDSNMAPKSIINISSSDIMQDDEVTVEYYDNPAQSGSLEAKGIELLKE